MQSTAQENDDFFSKCDQIRKKSLIENFIFCAVQSRFITLSIPN